MQPSAPHTVVKPQLTQYRSFWSLLIVFSLIGFLLISAAASPESSTPYSIIETTLTATELAPEITETPTATPEIFEENPEQTNGIVLGGVLLVLIIVGGTLSIIRRKD